MHRPRIWAGGLLLSQIPLCIVVVCAICGVMLREFGVIDTGPLGHLLQLFAVCRRGSRTQAQGHVWLMGSAQMARFVDAG